MIEGYFCAMASAALRVAEVVASQWAIIANGVAPVVASTHLAKPLPEGSTHVVIAAGQPTNNATRPTNAGLNGLPPNPP